MNRIAMNVGAGAMGMLLAAALAWGQTTSAHKAKPHAAKHMATQSKMAQTASPQAEPGSAAMPAEGTGAAARKRDPFVNPVQAVREGMGSSCTGGKRCLVVQEIVLRGVVKSVNGMIAVVENSAQRTYFLRENDPIYNGFVKSITPDSVVFRTHYIDNFGRDAEHDTVKTVNAPVV